MKGDHASHGSNWCIRLIFQTRGHIQEPNGGVFVEGAAITSMDMKLMW